VCVVDDEERCSLLLTACNGKHNNKVAHTFSNNDCCFFLGFNSGWWVNRQRSTLRKVPRTNITKDVRQQQIELLTSIGFLWQVPPAGPSNMHAARNVQQGAGSSSASPPAAVVPTADVADGVENQAVKTDAGEPDDKKVEPEKEKDGVAV
jgi:hypothetical protein